MAGGSCLARARHEQGRVVHRRHERRGCRWDSFGEPRMRLTKTHCKQGHLLTESNSRFTNKDGYLFRDCRTCIRERNRKSRVSGRRVSKASCDLCGRPMEARGLCSAHYMAWRCKNVPGVLDKRRSYDRSRPRPSKNLGRTTESIRRSHEKVVLKMPAHYIRKCFGVQKDAPPELINAFRTLLTIKRELRTHK